MHDTQLGGAVLNSATRLLFAYGQRAKDMVPGQSLWEKPLPNATEWL